ncbi:hypothetical protein [Porphyrobacter sp. AAP60]|uniref:hypothetical protein n=1 Tax=Porphyrobacter sp. AAP60 TaxID=1523423 RepID=UPI0006B9758C|nr:hypothetical protein [Porphyrobacter sp. AAP60]KPF64275.1 hypothetical protein IP79_05960 [Porphyrobacter sp. AAP60]
MKETGSDGLGDCEEISGEAVASWLSEEIGAELADALVGCRFYRQDPEDPVTILHCDRDSHLLTVRDTSGRRRNFALNGGFVYFDPRLAPVFQKKQNLRAESERQRREIIAAFGFAGEINSWDLDTLIDAIASTKDEDPPHLERRRNLVSVISRYDRAEALAKIMGNWADAAYPKILVDVLINLVPALRKAGLHKEAIFRTDFLHDRSYDLSVEERKILLTTRAAACLDQFEENHDQTALDKAAWCINECEGMTPSEHLSNVQRRLNRLR